MFPASYNEDADGFQFTRRTSRRITRAHPTPEPTPEEPARPAPAPGRRKKSPTAPEGEAQESGSKRTRRSARLSGDGENVEPTKPAAKAAKKSATTERRKKEGTPGVVPKETTDAVPVAKTPRHGNLHVAKKRDGGATKIMLPFADTPVIARNKEMRKASNEAHRRSSTGLRGRRASSLIDSGLSIGEWGGAQELLELYTAGRGVCAGILADVLKHYRIPRSKPAIFTSTLRMVSWSSVGWRNC